MAYKFKLTATTLLISLTSSFGIAQEQDLSTRIEAHLNQQVESQSIPGLAAVVVRDGQVVYLGAHGVTSLDSRELLTPEHVFPMASLSKTFVAAAISQLVDAGKLDLNAPVVNYLPYFQLADSRAGEIRLVQLLNHTSGMPNATEYGYDDPQFNKGALEDWVRQMDQLSLVSDPGQQFGYSDLAYEVLGDVIAKVSGVTFEQYMQANFFEPLGMKDSSFFYPDIKEELRTFGHINTPAEVSSIYPYNRRHAPSSALHSSVKDMANWVKAHLETHPVITDTNDEQNSGRIFDAEALNLIWEPTFDIADGVQIGLSWFIVDINGHRAVMHNGGDPAFRSQIMLFPDQNLGFVFSSNWQDLDVRAISSGLAAILLD